MVVVVVVVVVVLVFCVVVVAVLVVVVVAVVGDCWLFMVVVVVADCWLLLLAATRMVLVCTLMLRDGNVSFLESRLWARFLNANGLDFRNLLFFQDGFKRGQPRSNRETADPNFWRTFHRQNQGFFRRAVPFWLEGFQKSRRGASKSQSSW